MCAGERPCGKVDGLIAILTMVRTLTFVALLAARAWSKDEPTCASCDDAKPVQMVMIVDPGVDDAGSMLLALASSRAIKPK